MNLRAARSRCARIEKQEIVQRAAGGGEEEQEGEEEK